MKYRFLAGNPFGGPVGQELGSVASDGTFWLIGRGNWGDGLWYELRLPECIVRDHLGTWFEEVKPERWRPRGGDAYFHINERGEYVSIRWQNTYGDDQRFINFNVWRNREHGAEAARRCLETRKAYFEELMAKGEL